MINRIIAFFALDVLLHFTFDSIFFLIVCLMHIRYSELSFKGDR